MRTLIVRTSEPLRGVARVPGDKSISHRAALLGGMARGESVVRGFLWADDCLRTLAALALLGVEIQQYGETLVVRSPGYPGWEAPAQVVDCGNSGTTMRLLLGALAGRPFVATLDGDESLRQRPMDRVAVPLAMMGAQITGQGSACQPPVTIVGCPHLQPLTYSLPVASAQVKSALLLAGLQAAGTSVIMEPAPSRDHTERMLAAFGVPVRVQGRRLCVTGPACLQPAEVQVPGDLSAAAFLIAAALLVPSSEVTVEEVGLNPTRTGFLDVVAAMGAQLHWQVQEASSGEPVGTVTATSSRLRGVRVGGELIPRAIDELPLVAVLATQAEGETVVEEAQELRKKESDRLAAMAAGLRAMGAAVTERPDGWLIRGPTPLRGARLHARLDHRVAMALAVAGLIAEGETVIEGAQVVATSFPSFATCLAQLGAAVKAA
jgi:3-phosphoshikimate 1-carboxyvinyltransferase